jgi:hypothetical protein
VRRIGLWLLKDNRYAIIAVLLCSLLMLIPLPGDFLAGIIVGFITLKRGSLYGLYLLIFIALLAIGVTWQLHSFNIYIFLLLRTIFVWLGALAIRRFYSWTMTVELMAAVCLLVVFLLHIFFPNMTQIWKDNFLSYVSMFKSIKLGTVQVTVDQVINPVISMMTGLTVLFTAIGVLIQLMLARFWFAALFNPSGFAQELAMIRVSRAACVIFLMMMILTGWYHQALLDYLPVFFLPFIISGFSLLYFIAMIKQHWWPILVFIAIVLFAFLGVSIVLLVILSFIDSCFNLRLRLNLRSKNK